MWSYRDWTGACFAQDLSSSEASNVQHTWCKKRNYRPENNNASTTTDKISAKPIQKKQEEKAETTLSSPPKKASQHTKPNKIKDNNKTLESKQTKSTKQRNAFWRCLVKTQPKSIPLGVLVQNKTPFRPVFSKKTSVHRRGPRDAKGGPGALDGGGAAAVGLVSTTGLSPFFLHFFGYVFLFLDMFDFCVCCLFYLCLWLCDVFLFLSNLRPSERAFYAPFFHVFVCLSLEVFMEFFSKFLVVQIVCGVSLFLVFK